MMAEFCVFRCINDIFFCHQLTDEIDKIIQVTESCDIFSVIFEHSYATATQVRPWTSILDHGLQSSSLILGLMALLIPKRPSEANNGSFSRI